MKLGTIYAIICNKTGEVYIGSTTRKLSERIKEHRTKKNNGVSLRIIKRKNWKVKKLFEQPIKSKAHLRKIEQKFIKNIKCINSRNAC